MGDAYDVAVIGSGTGGYSAALRAAQLGKRVVLIDKDDRLGGTCLLRGCIPTKALLQSAAVMDTVNRSSTWGIQANGSPDWPRIVDAEGAVVDSIVSGLTGLISARGIEVVHGAATFVGGNRIAVGDRSIEATDIVLATGSRPKLLPGVTISDRVITSDEALWAERLPESAIVIGAGAVGLEFASMYRSFGAEVTIVEALPQLAPLEDADVSKELARAFRKRGITSAVGAVVKDLKDTDSAVEVTYEVDNAPTTVAADICLIAIGRGPVTEGIGLEEVGVTLQEKGFVAVDESLRTTAEHIWSVGDVAATPLQLAHVSFAEGIAVAERIAGQEPPPVDYVNVPRVTYCTPEVASVGLTEEQAREAGHDIETERLDLRAIGKAKILDEAGSVKVVAAAGGGPVLGVHMIGPHVTDLIAEAMLVTSWEATANDVAALIHPHPSLSEGFGEAMLALAGKALHSP